MLDAQSIDGNDTALRKALLEAALPVDDLEDDGRQFFRFASDGEVVGFGGLEVYGSDALVRSVVVLLQHRGKGLGRDMAEELFAKASAIGVRRTFLLTTTAQDFFAHLGFERIERKDAPAPILATQQATTICSTAPLMVRTIGGP